MPNSAGKLIGKWKLVRDGSDFLPGVDNLNGGPLVLKLLGRYEAEFFKIEKKKVCEVEEICLTYVTKNVNISRSYQLRTLNYESTVIPNVILAMVQNCDENLLTFSILRVGPGCGQTSREIFSLNQTTGNIKLTIEMSTGDGLHLNLIKYLSRFEPTTIKETSSRLTNSAVTFGWRLYEFWPSTVLSGCRVSIAKVIKVKTLNSTDIENGKVLESVWSSDAFSFDFRMDFGTVPRQFGNKVIESEEVLLFVIQVVIGEANWFVTRRYSEFLFLRSFISQQNPFNSSFNEMEESFPGKSMGFTFLKGVLQKRITGLEKFLTLFLENARYSRQTSIDAVLSFLQVPENLGATVKRRSSGGQTVLDGITPRPSIPASSNSSQNPTFPPKPTPEPVPTAEAFRRKSLTLESVEIPVETKKQTLSKVDETEERKSDSKTKTENRESPFAKQERSLKDTEAIDKLRETLEDGLTVIKHGRQGSPKERVLFCDPNVTMIYWHADQKDGKGKHVNLAEVTEVRLGTDVDPATPASALENKDAEENAPKREVKRRKSSFFKKSDPLEILYGTETLRKHCSPEDMQLAISLILPSRTFDIQCLNETDYEMLKNCLTQICTQN